MNSPHHLTDGEIGRQFAIYVNDHRAGAEGAEALARRSARSNADNIVGAYLGNEFLSELFEQRVARADKQLERLAALHRWAAAQAFDGSGTCAAPRTEPACSQRRSPVTSSHSG